MRRNGTFLIHGWEFTNDEASYGGGGKMSWYERETMTILNPNPTDTEVTVTFYLDGEMGVEKFIVPKAFGVGEPCEHGQRVYPLWLFDVEHLGLANRKRSMAQSSMRVMSNLPIVVQKTRKAVSLWRS